MTEMAETLLIFVVIPALIGAALGILKVAVLDQRPGITKSQRDIHS